MTPIAVRSRLMRLWHWSSTAVLLVMLSLIGGVSAVAADGTSSRISIDTGQFPKLVVTADNSPVADILRQLGERLGFSVDNLPADTAHTVTGTFHGELTELLQSDLLGRMNFVTLGRAGKLERLIVVSYDRGSDAKRPSGVNTVSADEQKPAQPTPAAERLPDLSPHPAAAPAGRVKRMLHDQAVQGAGRLDIDNDRNAGADQTPAADATAAGDPSLGAMTQAAHANAQALVSALRAVCLGPNCAH